MTDNAGRAWNDVEPALRRSMMRHGIDAQDWEHYRSTPIWTDVETKAEFIRPEDIWRELVGANVEVGEHAARFDAAAKFNAMIATEGIFGST